MKILHYFLGFPPYRSGGLTKYAYDLMKSQVDDGHNVIGLWPGKIEKYSAQPKLTLCKRTDGIYSCELINPLPVPLDEGIKEFDAFMKTCDEEIYTKFLYDNKIDVIHIHTLMGLHREFVNAANRLKIRTIFTSHDYFGLCPKVTLYRYGKCCDNDDNCKKCIQCNVSALSLKKIQLMQSPLYRYAKNLPVVKFLRKQHRNKFFEKEELPQLPNGDLESLSLKYEKLREYYVEMYEMIDFIHYNSTVAKEIYERYITPKNSKVISITHRFISQHSRKKVETDKKVILSLAPAKPYKGWNIIKEACDQLWNEGENIELRVYSSVPKHEPYMIVNENGFSYSDLDKIMSEVDVLVAPSIWYETFGFTVLEALSYGVPVIVSDHVGAKDIVGNNGIIVEAGNIKDLKSAICNYGKNVTIELKKWDSFMAENYYIYKGDLNEFR